MDPVESGVRALTREEKNKLNVEPAVGSTPPSAGVTPAPSNKKKSEIARTRFRSGVGIGVLIRIPRPLFHGRG